LNATPTFEYLIDTLRVDTSDGFLGSLYRDTLILTAELSECGEWGGNREFIKVFREQRVTKCIILHDSADCANFDRKTRYMRTDSSFFILERSDEKAIIKYMHDLTELSFFNQYPLANAMHIYSAKIVSSDPESFRLAHFETHAIDWSFMWPNFMELCLKLKN
jgi:hypothetical protein